MSSQGPLSPATTGSDSSVGTEVWASTSSIVSKNGAGATAAIATSEISEYLTAKNFGFTIPAGSTIDGIVVEVVRWTDSVGVGNAADYRVRIIKNSAIGSTDKATGGNWQLELDPGYDSYISYGGVSDLWGETWTYSQINSANFGVAIACQETSGFGGTTAEVDHVRVTVYYTAGAPVSTTILNFTGFELGTDTYQFVSVSEGSSISNTGDITSSVVRTGSYALIINPTTTANGSFRLEGIAGDGTPEILDEPDLYTRFYFRYGTKPASNSEEIFVVASDATGNKFSLRIDSSGNLRAFDKDTSQIGSAGATVLSVDVWYNIECYVETGTGGAFEVRINGATELSGTANLTTSNTDIVYFGKVTNRNSQTVVFYYDDIAIGTGNWIGNGGIKLYNPDSNGIYDNWAGDYTDTDDVPIDGNTTYIYHDSTTLDDDTFSVGLESSNSVIIPGSIVAIKPFVVARLTGGTTGQTKLLLRSGTTDSETDAYANSVAYEFLGDIYQTDPDTSASLTVAVLDQMQVGIEAIEMPTGANTIRATSLGIMALYSTDVVNISIGKQSVRVRQKQVTNNNVGVGINRKRLGVHNKSLTVITNSIIPISKKRLKISLKQAGIGTLISLNKIRLKTRNKAVVFTSPVNISLNRVRLKTRNKTATSPNTSLFTINGGIPLYIGGSTGSQVTGSLSTFIWGTTNPGIFKSFDLSITGRLGSLSGGSPDSPFPLSIRGTEGPLSGFLPLSISGPITSGTVYGSLPIFLEAKLPSGWLRLYVKGQGLSPNSPDGAQQLSGGIPLYLHRPPAVENSLTMFMKVANETSGALTCYTNGVTGFLSSGLTLQMFGLGEFSSSAKLFIKGF